MRDLEQDALGNPTRLTGPALQAADRFVSAFLGYRRRIVEILADAEAHPRALLLQVYAGVLHMLAESPEGPPRARRYAERARALCPGAHPRETLWVSALEAWAAMERSEAARLLEAIVSAHPRDLTAVKLRQLLSFNRGDAEGMLRIVDRAAAEDVAALHAMRAFALEELNALGAAEAAAGRALAIDPAEPWAQHALAHVMLARGRMRQGAAFLRSFKDGWAPLNSFMSTHLHWHLALFELSLGRGEEALRLYDDGVWGDEPDLAQDQVGAISLLARLELAGLSPGRRWEALGERLAAREEDVFEPFLSVHYLYGLGRAGRPQSVRRLLEAIRTAARVEDDPVWRVSALPLAEGLTAYLEGRPGEAAERLRSAQASLGGLGGSHAQRDLFELILIDALIASGSLEEALGRLEAGLLGDPEGAVVNRALAEVLRRLGNENGALAAEARLRIHA